MDYFKRICTKFDTLNENVIYKKRKMNFYKQEEVNLSKLLEMSLSSGANSRIHSRGQKNRTP